MPVQLSHLEHNGAPLEFAAAGAERIRDMVEKTNPFKTSEGIRRSIKFRSATVAKLLISMRTVVQASKVVVPDESDSYIRKTRDGKCTMPILWFRVDCGFFTFCLTIQFSHLVIPADDTVALIADCCWRLQCILLFIK